MVDILNFYGIKLSCTLQTKLDSYLVLPRRSLEVTKDDVQQRPNQPNDQPEMILLLKKSATWKMLKELFNDLQSFLLPIASQLEFLVYFHMHNCEMFSIHLKSQMATISSNVGQLVQESAATLTLSTIAVQQSSSHSDKLLQVAS